MLKIETSTVINRPVEEVFAVASNPEDGPKWSPGLVEVKKTSEGPIGVGSTYRLVRMFLGQRIEGDMELTEYEPNQKFTQDSKSRPFPVEARWTFDAVEGALRSVSSSRQSRAASSSLRSRSSGASPKELWKPSSPT